MASASARISRECQGWLGAAASMAERRGLFSDGLGVCLFARGFLTGSFVIVGFTAAFWEGKVVVHNATRVLEITFQPTSNGTHKSIVHSRVEDTKMIKRRIACEHIKFVAGNIFRR